jgi:hypothetical protein
MNEPTSNRPNMPSYQEPMQNHNFNEPQTYQNDNNYYEANKYNEAVDNGPSVNEENSRQPDYSGLNNNPYDKGFNTIDAIGNQPNLSNYPPISTNPMNYNLNPSSQNSSNNQYSNNNQSINSNSYMYNNNNNGSSNYYVR